MDKHRRLSIKLILAPLIIVILIMTTLHSHGADKKRGTLDYGSLSCGGAPDSDCETPMTIEESKGSTSCRPNAADLNTRRAIVPQVEFAAFTNGGDKHKLNSNLHSQGYTRIKLSEKPIYSTSAAWSDQGTEFLVVDASRKVILQYSIDGHLIQTINLGVDVARIQRLETGYLLQIASSPNFIRTDSHFRSSTVESLASGMGNDGAIYGWTFMEDGFLAFGDINSKDGWKKGRLLRITHNSPPAVEDLRQVDQGGPARHFFLMGYPLIAKTESNVYALIMERKKPYILEVGFGVRELKVFPRDFSTTPTLAAGGKTEDAHKIYTELENKTTATGLIGWNNYLYLLTRKPMSNGKTEWMAWKINPCQDQVISSFKLPTQTEHIVISTNPSLWAILEKGPVVGFGKQEVKSLLLIDPASLERRGVF